MRIFWESGAQPPSGMWESHPNFLPAGWRAAPGLLWSCMEGWMSPHFILPLVFPAVISPFLHEHRLFQVGLKEQFHPSWDPGRPLWSSAVWKMVFRYWLMDLVSHLEKFSPYSRRFVDFPSSALEAKGRTGTAFTDGQGLEEGEMGTEGKEINSSHRRFRENPAWEMNLGYVGHLTWECSRRNSRENSPGGAGLSFGMQGKNWDNLAL